MMKNEKNYFEIFFNFHLTFNRITSWLKLDGEFRSNFTSDPFAIHQA
jgi:hypothetical protein